jgi:septum formation protein
MLRRLSGRTHEVLTGVSLRLADWHGSRVESTTVELSRLTEAEIRWYRESGEGRDKAGAYAIQGLGAPLIERVDGDFFGVMGLPLRLALDLLGRFGRPYRFGD